MVKSPSALQERRVRSLGREDPLEEGLATRSSVLAWSIPWTEEPGGLQSTGSQGAGPDRATHDSKNKRADSSSGQEGAASSRTKVHPPVPATTDRAAVGKVLTVGKRGRAKPREKRDATRTSEPAGKAEPRRAAEETTPPLRPQRGAAGPVLERQHRWAPD